MHNAAVGKGNGLANNSALHQAHLPLDKGHLWSICLGKVSGLGFGPRFRSTEYENDTQDDCKVAPAASLVLYAKQMQLVSGKSSNSI